MSLRIAISIGTARFLSFAELNLASCRRVFGSDTPILISDAFNEVSPEMEKLAERYGAYYIGEESDRGHFSGCTQNAVNAVAFAKEHGADIALKINQRFILVNPGIVEIIEQVFHNEFVDVALPGRPDFNRLITSKFFASFPFLVDCIFMRSSAFDPHYLKQTYEAQWKTRQDKYGSYTEVWWMNLLNGRYKSRYATLNCLTDHSRTWDCFFLRKVQNNAADYVGHSQSLGLNFRTSDFPCEEWSQILGVKYNPFPKS